MILFASTVAVSLYNELDKTMIGFLANDEQVGYYSASRKITKLVIALITAVLTVIISMIPLATFCSTQIFIPLRKDKYTFYPVLVGAIVNALFNVFLILKLGGLGTGIATVIAESSVTFASFVLVKKSEVAVRNLFRYFWQYLIASIIMAVAVYFEIKTGQKNFIFTVLGIFLVVLIYFSVLLIMKNKYLLSFWKRK